MPTTLSNESGVATGCPSSRSWRPAGFVASVSRAMRGRMSRCVMCVSPPASRTVSVIRYHTFADVSPSVGIVNDPPVAPVVDATNGCVWVS